MNIKSTKIVTWMSTSFRTEPNCECSIIQLTKMQCTKVWYLLMFNAFIAKWFIFIKNTCLIKLTASHLVTATHIWSSTPQFSNEFMPLFSKCHSFADEFHKKILNLIFNLALALFKVDNDQAINNHVIYSFVTSRQVYNKRNNMAFHPTKATKCSEDAINKRLKQLRFHRLCLIQENSAWMYDAKKRHQFPVRPLFAITIDKAQGKHLWNHWWSSTIICFVHGMIYVVWIALYWCRQNLEPV